MNIVLKKTKRHVYKIRWLTNKHTGDANKCVNKSKERATTSIFSSKYIIYIFKASLLPNHV